MEDSGKECFPSQETFTWMSSPAGAFFGLRFCLWGPQSCLMLFLQLSGCPETHLPLEGC